MFPYERLRVWQRAHRLAVAVLAAPDLDGRDQRRDAVAQLRRATLSISANIAEGAGSASHALFARHLGIARASAHESQAVLRALGDAGLVDPRRYTAWMAELRAIAAMLQALRRRVRSDPRRTAATGP